MQLVLPNGVGPRTLQVGGKLVTAEETLNNPWGNLRVLENPN